MIDLSIVLVAVAAFSGGITSALLGWTESSEPFNVRQFMSSVIRSIIGAGGIAIMFNYTEAVNPTMMAIIAFIAGAGFDAGGNKIAGAISARK